MTHGKFIMKGIKDSFNTSKCPAGTFMRRLRLISGRPFIHIIGVVLLGMTAGSCAAAFHKPDPFDYNNLRNSAITASRDNIRVSAAVPGPEESRNIFGIDLEKKGFQPLWLEIQNNTERTIHFLPTGLDPEYFSPGEVSFGFHRLFSKRANRQIDDHIDSLSFRTLINPHSTSSGFVFTNPDRGNKFVALDLVGTRWTESFMLVVPTLVHSIADDRYESVLRMEASSEFIEAEDESHLRELLEQLPCCSSTKDGVQTEPLNIVLIGEIDDFLPAFTRRNYRYASVAPRYVFQRPQDISASKLARWVTAQPHVLRLWLTTIRFNGNPVWIGQVITPYGGRFARAAGDNKDLIIDPFVDEARNDMIQDIIYSQYLVRMGFVKGVGRVMASSPRKLPGGAAYNTDGLRAVLMFKERPVSLSEIELFEWENLVDYYRQQIDINK